MRKIKQVVFANGLALIVKCTDETFWHLVGDKWIQLPPIPQDSEGVN